MATVYYEDPDEVWRPIEGYEGRYAVSDRGHVMNVRKGGRLLIPRKTNGYHLSVSLFRNNQEKIYPVHKLVLEAFIGPRPAGLVACHGPAGPADNSIQNLRWGTQSSNMYDAVRDGANHNANKFECIRGHGLAGPNLTVLSTPRAGGDGGPGRKCKACHRAHARVTRALKKGVLLDMQEVSDICYTEIMNTAA